MSCGNDARPGRLRRPRLVVEYPDLLGGDEADSGAGYVFEVPSLTERYAVRLKVLGHRARAVPGRARVGIGLVASTRAAGMFIKGFGFVA